MAAKKKDPGENADEPQATTEPQAPDAEVTEPEAAAEALAPAPEETHAAPPEDAPAQEPVVAGQTPEVSAQAEEPLAAEAPAPAGETPSAAEEAVEEAPEGQRAKPAVPGAHLEVDIVPEGVDPLGRTAEDQYEDRYAVEEEDLAAAEPVESEEEPEALTEPIASAAIDLAAGARYRAT
ncbi:MAG TPA: hypothetical protein VNZ05_09595, partial [Solirubrobacteraceae bacterium]|nr:hypothetical protein [Solirubrobacteraceae bacterium]